MKRESEGRIFSYISGLYQATAAETLWDGIIKLLKASPWQECNCHYPLSRTNQPSFGSHAGKYMADTVSQYGYDASEAGVTNAHFTRSASEFPFGLRRSSLGDEHIPAGSATLRAQTMAALLAPSIDTRPDLDVLGSARLHEAWGETAESWEALLQHSFLALQILRKLQQLRDERGAIESGVSQMAIGMILVTCDKRATPLNDEARIILAQRELESRDGRLTTADKRARDQLDKLLAGLMGESDGPPAGGGLTIRRMNGHALQVWCVPLSHKERALLDPRRRPCGLLFVFDPDRVPLTPDNLLMNAFGLTGAETRLTLALLHGETVDEYCARTDISRNTARTHMRAIFDKLGINKQTELIRLLSCFRLLKMGGAG